MGELTDDQSNERISLLGRLFKMTIKGLKYKEIMRNYFDT